MTTQWKNKLQQARDFKLCIFIVNPASRKPPRHAMGKCPLRCKPGDNRRTWYNQTMDAASLAKPTYCRCRAARTWAQEALHFAENLAKTNVLSLSHTHSMGARSPSLCRKPIEHLPIVAFAQPQYGHKPSNSRPTVALAQPQHGRKGALHFAANLPKTDQRSLSCCRNMGTRGPAFCRKPSKTLPTVALVRLQPGH